MTKENIVNDTTEIVAGILKHRDFVLSDEMTAGQIRGWDSLSHMVIISAVEKHFSVKFSFAEVLSFNNMGDMFNSIQDKLS